MKYTRDFCYNQDFEWYETEVFVDQDLINLFVPSYIESDLSLLHQRFANIVSWILKNRDLVDALCFKNLSHHLSRHGESPCREKLELTLLSLSLEKGNAFELLLECRAHQKYIILLFDIEGKLLECKIDF